jgi:hypothetical protein
MSPLVCPKSYLCLHPSVLTSFGRARKLLTQRHIEKDKSRKLSQGHIEKDKSRKLLSQGHIEKDKT